MGVYINMEMPKDGCMDCPMHKWTFASGEKCCITGETVGGNVERGGFPTNCPLVPVPEHGRLIDESMILWCVDWYAGRRRYYATPKTIEHLPTIIPADKEGEG